MKKIAFLATSYIAKYDGVSVYTENLLKELISKKEHIKIDIYVDKNICSLLKERISLKDQTDPLVNFKEIESNSFFNKIYLLHKILLKEKYDLIFMPNSLPVLVPTQKMVRVTHDLSYKNLPKNYSILRRIYLNFLKFISIYMDDAIGYISETTKKDLLKYFNIPKEKKFLYLPNGIPFKVKKLQRPTYEEIENKFLQRNLKILVVGRINRHKGFDRVLEFIKFADKVIKEDGYFSSIEINFVGKKTEETDTIIDNYKPKNIKLNFLGFLSDDELNKLYKESHFCFFLSRNEGYGLPLVEALWLGTIPILSDIPIFREIMGNDYIFFSEETGYGKSIYKTIKNIFEYEDYRRNIFNKIENVVQKEKEGYKTAAENLLNFIYLLK